jgi:hypothetical protein
MVAWGSQAPEEANTSGAEPSPATEASPGDDNVLEKPKKERPNYYLRQKLAEQMDLPSPTYISDSLKGLHNIKGGHVLT